MTKIVLSHQTLMNARRGRIPVIQALPVQTRAVLTIALVPKDRLETVLLVTDTQVSLFM